MSYKNDNVILTLKMFTFSLIKVPITYLFKKYYIRSNTTIVTSFKKKSLFELINYYWKLVLCRALVFITTHHFYIRRGIKIAKEF